MPTRADHTVPQGKRRGAVGVFANSPLRTCQVQNSGYFFFFAAFFLVAFFFAAFFLAAM